MVDARKSERKGFLCIWRIENFDFCWHKTGDELQSELFSFGTPQKSYWRLFLYPRGKYDGEYISCYLWKGYGGPEVLDVDFEFSLSVEDSILVPSVSFMKIYSFKDEELKGENCFVQRRKVFDCKEAQKNGFTLTVRCRIWNRIGEYCEETVNYQRCIIAVERISAIQVHDNDAIIDTVSNQDIEVKPLLEDEPLINISLSHIEENLTIKIQPNKCDKIKYAVCKVSILKYRSKEIPIEYSRFWIGEIKSDVWRCHLPLLETEGTKNPDDITPFDKIILLRYEFTYSIGVEYWNYESQDWGTNSSFVNLLVPIPPRQNVESKKYLHVLKTLEDVYTSNSYEDVNIMAQTKSFSCHKAFLCTRSSKFQRIFHAKVRAMKIKDFDADTVGRFLLFLYTDRVENLPLEKSIKLYMMADEFGVKLLKDKCRRYLESICDVHNISKLLDLADSYQDLVMKANIEKIVDEDPKFCQNRVMKQFLKIRGKVLQNRSANMQ